MHVFPFAPTLNTFNLFPVLCTLQKFCPEHLFHIHVSLHSHPRISEGGASAAEFLTCSQGESNVQWAEDKETKSAMKGSTGGCILQE